MESKSDVLTSVEMQPYIIDKPFGSMNVTGVMCYFNSLLQALYSCPSFVRSIIDNRTLFDDSKNLLGSALCRICEFLISDIDRDKYKAKAPYFAKYVLDALIIELDKQGKKLNFGNNQECAHEGLTLLVDLLKCKPIEKLFTQKRKQIIKCMECHHIIEKEDINIYHNTGMELINDEPAFIKNWYKKVELLRDYTCDKCKSKSCVLSNIVTAINDIIVIIYPKFFRKSLEYFPEKFTIKATDKTMISINAVSLIEHYGTMDGGHYTCRARRGKSIYHFNDSSYSECDLSPSTNTFMVIYHINQEGK